MAHAIVGTDVLESQSLAIALLFGTTALLGILAWGVYLRNRRADSIRAEERHQAAISAARSEYPELAEVEWVPVCAAAFDRYRAVNGSLDVLSANSLNALEVMSQKEIVEAGTTPFLYWLGKYRYVREPYDLKTALREEYIGLSEAIWTFKRLDPEITACTAENVFPAVTGYGRSPQDALQDWKYEWLCARDDMDMPAEKTEMRSLLEEGSDLL